MVLDVESLRRFQVPGALTGWGRFPLDYQLFFVDLGRSLGRHRLGNSGSKLLPPSVLLVLYSFLFASLASELFQLLRLFLLLSANRYLLSPHLLRTGLLPPYL